MVEPYWLDNPKQREGNFGKEFWDQGKWDVVKEGGYWDNGKWIPMDIAEKVKEIVGREVKMMKGKMQQDEVKTLEQIHEIKVI